MDNSFVFYSVSFITHIIPVSLALAILMSVYMKSKRNGLILLLVFMVLHYYTLSLAFEDSALLGTGFLLIDIVLAIAAYYTIQRKKRRLKEENN
ncbi:hypothetical protein [Bacillus sp. AK031]